MHGDTRTARLEQPDRSSPTSHPKGDRYGHLTEAFEAADQRLIDAKLRLAEAQRKYAVAAEDWETAYAEVFRARQRELFREETDGAAPQDA